ncbi:MAG TPA: hypothetical protein VND64_29365 [Pirellulales bacterium]|nr:hypothetical protein [Pirellulales bacterium]
MEGYTGDAPDSRLTPGFPPLYSLSMRWLGDAAGCGYFTAGIWISRLALLIAMALLAVYAQEREGSAGHGWRAGGALLTFPSAFILASVYAESLFLVSALAAFVLARRGRHGWAALAAFGAALTRIHGLALLPGLAVLGWEQWRAKRDDDVPSTAYDVAAPDTSLRGKIPGLWCLAPALGAAAAYLALAAYFWEAIGDPLAHFTAKREGWRQGFTAPWVTLDTALEHLDRAAAHRNLGSLYTILELPCFYLIVGTVGVLCARRWWPEATYVGCAGAMSLCSGSLAGLPRFTLVMFPVFIVLARMRRWPVVWGIYLVVGAVLQVGLLVNFVRFGAPPP